jgi:PAS domain S-box-containing protein
MSEIMSAEQSLLQSQEHFDTLVLGVEDYAIFLLSPEGNVISWNAGARHIIGYDAEEILGKHFSIFYPPEGLQRDRPRQVLKIAAKEGKFTEEGWRVRKDRSQFWASVVITALRTEKGTLRGFLKITRDLSERRKVELLEEANRQKDEFLATLSHELRTPLNAILGWTSLMKESPDDVSLVSQGLSVLERNTKTLTGLIADLLDISKITAGTMALDFAEVDLKRIVSSSVETLRVQAAEKSITLEKFFEFSSEIDCRIGGDEVRLQQILTNILGNSLKFTPKGGTVTVHLRKAQATATILVKDNGRGIPPEFLPRVFEQFAQCKAGPGENRGMGLGMAICKHLVELHHGSISVESEGICRGTTVKVELPLIASRPPASLEPIGEKERMPDARLDGIKVLVVDDDGDTRDLLKAILERSSADATIVSSGQAALEAVRNIRPDVLVCDLAMPIMDGYELLEKVRHLEQEVGWLPIIAFTASARSKDRVRSRRAGFQAHLTKPVDPNELVTTITKLVKPEAN